MNSKRKQRERKERKEKPNIENNGVTTAKARTLVCTKTPAATPDFKAVKNWLFIHFLSAGKLDSMYFLIAIILEPLRSLSSAIAAVIPALYDMIVELKCKGEFPTLSSMDE
jgi:hypothetical protein